MDRMAFENTESLTAEQIAALERASGLKYHGSFAPLFIPPRPREPLALWAGLALACLGVWAVILFTLGVFQ